MNEYLVGHRKLVSWGIIVLVILLLPWVVGLMGEVPAYILNLSAIFAIVAISLNLLTGYSGQVSLGHAGFVMLGEYCAALLTLKVGLVFWLALPVTVFLVGCIGFLIGLPAVRLTGNFLAVATLGFGLAIPEIALNWQTLTRGSLGLMPTRPSIGSFTFGSDISYYYLIAFFLAIVVWVSVGMLKHKTGRAFQAIRDSEIAAVSSGINPAYYKALAFALSAGFAGLAGCLYAHYVNFVSPNDFSVQDSFIFLAMIVVGGMASLWGAVIGAVLLTVVTQLSTGLGGFSIILVGAVVIVAIVSLPGGLVSLFHTGTYQDFCGLQMLRLRQWRSRR